MSTLSIKPPFVTIQDTDGQPLQNGYIWIGTANLDPIANPINVYWDSALTLPAAQPIRTINGFPARNGSPGTLYVSGNYSIQVQNKNGSVVYSAASVTENVPSTVVTFTQSGTGAEVRSVENKLRETISVADFGAVGNGVIDDAVAIQNAANAAQGKRLLFSANATYYCANEVLLLANTEIDLQGATINFDVVGAKYCFKLADDCTVTNGTVNQINATNEPGVNGSHRCPITVGSFNAGFASQGKRNAVLRNLELRNSRPSGQCISIYSDSFNVLIENCAIYDGGGAKNGIAAHWSLDTGTPADGTQHPSAIKISNCVLADFDVGIYLSAAYQVLIENCKFLDCAKGVEAYRGDYSNTYAPSAVAPFVGKNITVLNCQFRGCAIGVEVDGIEGLVAAQNIMSVDIVSCIMQGPAAGTTSDVGVYIRGMERGSIRNCTIFEFDGYGIDFRGDGSNTVIEGCVIFDNAYSAIYSRDTDTITGININNCRIYGNAATSPLSTKPAIQIGALCKNWEVKNCEFGETVGETQATSVAITPGATSISVVNNHTYGVVDYAYRVTGATSFATTDTLKLNFVGNTVNSGITLYDGSPCATIVGPGIRHVWYSTAPVAGTWAVGDLVWNTTPTAGGFIGWVCVSAGTPGTWKTFGAITV